MRSIIVFSHLRWDFVYQRPQHLLSRLAENYQIIFFEEPEFRDGPPELSESRPLPNLTVYRPLTPVREFGFHDAQMPYLRQMVQEVADGLDNPIVWFYTPMALPLLDEVRAQHVIYDCMDELSAFKNPPPHLVERERKLLDMADLVFAGGPSLYQSKRQRNRNAHCFPSSVDVNHFRQALDRNIAHPTHQNLPRPRLGFYGVIDERLDVDLVGALADAHPEWQLVLVGPVVKIDPAILPQRPNVHYMGQQPYTALPHFLAAWDVCLMPFALNESTKFISPTKSLEYMAAELPIVSTPIKDVVDLHSDVVEIANGTQDFIAACERVIGMSSDEKRKKVRMMREKLSRTSWNVTASEMHNLIKQLDAWEDQDEVAQEDAFPLQAGSSSASRAAARD
ncbi:Glycosyltransferase involved in cell wall bisynthesis [Noviherbaspirillum humi]|uniref:Glycosyltransferase involved in cell wall bisynthesis n=1 Tax=Noviherbaspirillum humi TaxID=1688639 RepID=A0A239LPE1_9BURK|nr:glycosyltransferase [Noviherbaspirillum humi]SNT32225.1 Glycosyltransferase involved in cell wall bisynthesis [Noviherbaspirillum humi]